LSFPGKPFLRKKVSPDPFQKPFQTKKKITFVQTAGKTNEKHCEAAHDIPDTEVPSAEQNGVLRSRFPIPHDFYASTAAGLTNFDCPLFNFSSFPPLHHISPTNRL